MSQPISLNAYPTRSGFVTIGTSPWEKSDPLSSEAHLPSCSEPASNHSHVYYSYRLHIVNSRITASGTVDKFIEEADGDVHLRTNLDQAYSNLTNTANDQYQYGYLVVEIICVNPPSQTDAIPHARTTPTRYQCQALASTSRSPARMF